MPAPPAFPEVMIKAVLMIDGLAQAAESQDCPLARMAEEGIFSNASSSHPVGQKKAARE